jgi:hypothetical protein
VTERARRLTPEVKAHDELAVYLEVKPGAADGIDAMSSAELRDRLIDENVAGLCAPRDSGPAIDVVRIINQDPTGAQAGDTAPRGHEFRCAELTR